MFNNLKRRYSVDESDKSDFNKRPKVLSDIPSPETYDYTDLYSNPITHPTQLPPSPPVINDPTIPASITCTSSIDTIPTLKRFTISTRQQQQHDPVDITSAYTGINNLLYQLHLERYSENNHNNNQQDVDMMGNNNNNSNNINNSNNEVYQYNMVNAILRQAFLERHPISK
ncbi:hypothetical protein BJ944DRAFT_259443 [Cunninghamella echinulata]|nr:hypothetical protein BJ944DRAFT_259443 [Cunninghamella echinulata]